MEDQDGRNRRRYPRIRAEAVLGIHRVDGATQRAETPDLGVGGVRLQCSGLEVDIGDVIEVTIQLADRSVTLKAKVIRLGHPDLLVQDVALEFLDVDPKTLERLYDLGLWEYVDEPDK